MNDEPLQEIDDEYIEDDSIFESVKARNFAAGLPVFYPEDEDRPDAHFWIVEYQDGRKLRVPINDLEKYVA